MKVEFSPWKKLEIRAYIRLPGSDEFANHVAAPTPAAMTVGSTTVLWADGIVFRHVPLNSPTEAIANEYLQGHIVWDNIEFAPMPKYVSELKAATRPSLTISVINVSSNYLFADVAKWAKSVGKRGGRRVSA